MTSLNLTPIAMGDGSIKHRKNMHDIVMVNDSVFSPITPVGGTTKNGGGVATAAALANNKR